jgi:hypothetical protein
LLTVLGLVAKKDHPCLLVIRQRCRRRLRSPLERQRVAPTPLSDTFRVISPDSTTFADSACCGTRLACIKRRQIDLIDR